MPAERPDAPRVIVAALRGGSGKTILSLGLTAALRRRGWAVAPFKKGPDYIDAGWLALAAGRPCYNLDSFLLDAGALRRCFHDHFHPGELAVIEGNRGLYDASDLAGSTSTAELAKLLQAPVLLCVDATKTTRTMAAVVAGCRQFDPAVPIAGVVLNRVAGRRHERILRESIEHFCRLPVVGAVPKLGRDFFPERHMGLVPTPEHDWALKSIEEIGRTAERYLDLAAVERIARAAPALPAAPASAAVPAPFPPAGARPRIGVIRDSAFQFYYQENLEALEDAGGELVFLSPLAGGSLPEVDALYIGGGFPETHAGQLAANREFAAALRRAVEDGLPVYAECGGLMYLGRKLVLSGTAYTMAGVLPLTFDFHQRPQGHGYTEAEVQRPNPFYPVGTEIRGHEFHYSRVTEWPGDPQALAFRMRRGGGITADLDGFVYKNVLATYLHVHALGTPGWAPAVVRNAARYRQQRGR